MTTQTRAQSTEIEYRLAPWHLRLRWWAMAGFWRMADLFAPLVDESPEQQNALWHR